MKDKNNKQPIYIIILLILAGEAVFILPFVLARIFRPTFLESFSIDNFQLGTCFSIYGIIALVSYLFGGPLADKYNPRVLMSIALFMTALGGFYMATYPSYLHMKFLFGYWGFTTIFLFWAPMIKATRLWGGTDKQGLAFGFLDGGRGLVAASFGAVGVLVFSSFMTHDIAETTLLERQEAFKYVILFSSIAIAFIGVLILIFLKTLNSKEAVRPNAPLTLSNFKSALKFRSVWLLMIIILCAYFGYKMTDVFSLYAKDVMLYNDIESATIGTTLLYIRPIIGVVIGLLADKTKASLWLIIGFILMLITSVIFASGIISESLVFLFFASIIFMALGVYSARVLYFATLQEANIPLALTGTVVGLVSIIGYTPDIFAGPLIGYLLDSYHGELGHQYAFFVMALFSILGGVASIIFYSHTKKIKKK
ncbi:MFS transporter [Changchengzhania lutea]|uniref:MFS transporter n=1 Tax=Changchengzhania lutea TaxID=2049305 RepID=UPI00115EAF40|nr:MFS transporter [Changchengzhania lutea]